MSDTYDYTPDVANGAILYGIGTVPLPQDGLDPDSAMVNIVGENVLDLLYYIDKKGIDEGDRNRRGILTLTSGPMTQTVYWTDATAIGPASPSSDIVAELDIIDVPAGARLRVGRKDPGMSGRTLVVKNGVGGSTIATIAAGDVGWAEAEFYAGEWVVTAWGGTITVV